MNRLKKIQHKQEREFAPNKESNDLKRQVKELKRQIKRLEKELEKGLPALEEQIMAEKLEIADDNEDTGVITAPSQCPLCNKQSLFIYTTPHGRKIQGCKSCRKHRLQL